MSRARATPEIFSREIYEDIPGLYRLRLVSLVAIIISIVTIGIDSAVYNYLTNVKLGAWWAALCIILLALVSIAFKSIAIILVLAIFVIIISAIGTVLDFSGSVYFSSSFYSCTTTSNILSGDSKYFLNATSCYLKDLNESKPISDCYCFDFYGCVNINGQGDCGNLFGYYTNLLNTASYFDFLSFLSVIALTVVAISIMCCPGSCGLDNRVSSIYANNEPLYDTGAQAIPVHSSTANARIATAEYVNSRSHNNAKLQPTTVVDFNTNISDSENLPVVHASLVTNK